MHTASFVSFGSEYKLLYLYMTIVKVEKATVAPKYSHLSAEYLKISLTATEISKTQMSDKCLNAACLSQTPFLKQIILISL